MRKVKRITATTRQLDMTDDRWNQLFGLPEGTKTKRKVIKMTPRLQNSASQLDGASFPSGPTTKAQVDDLLARESRNGEIFVGLVGVDSGQLIIVDPAYLKTWKHFDNDEKNQAEGDYEKVADITSNGAGQVAEPVLNGGAVASETNGDGGMPVYATFVDGRVTSLRIEMND